MCEGTYPLFQFKEEGVLQVDESNLKNLSFDLYTDDSGYNINKNIG